MITALQRYAQQYAGSDAMVSRNGMLGFLWFFVGVLCVMVLLAVVLPAPWYELLLVTGGHCGIGWFYLRHWV